MLATGEKSGAASSPNRMQLEKWTVELKLLTRTADAGDLQQLKKSRTCI